MFHRPFLEGDGPVRVIADWCRNEKAFGQFRINDHLDVFIQLCHEGLFNLGIGKNVVIDMTVGPYRPAKILLIVNGEYIAKFISVLTSNSRSRTSFTLTNWRR